MTQAELFVKKWDSLREFDDDSNMWWPAPATILETMPHEAKELCPESYDSSIIATFCDGSRLYVANPNQGAFSSWFEILEGEAQ